MWSTYILWMSGMSACEVITEPTISLSLVPSSCPVLTLWRPDLNTPDTWTLMLVLQTWYVYIHSFGGCNISAPENTAPCFGFGLSRQIIKVISTFQPAPATVRAAAPAQLLLMVFVFGLQCFMANTNHKQAVKAEASMKPSFKIAGSWSFKTDTAKWKMKFNQALWWRKNNLLDVRWKAVRVNINLVLDTVSLIDVCSVLLPGGKLFEIAK